MSKAQNNQIKGNNALSRKDRFKNFIKNSAIGKGAVKIGSAIANGFKAAINKTTKALFNKSFDQLKDTLSDKWDAFKETKAGKAFTALTSSGVGRVAAVTLAGLTIAGLLSPAAPAVAAAIGALTLTAVAAGVAIETYQVRSARRLNKENNLLVNNRDAKTLQNELLKDNEKLKELLGDKLKNHDKEASIAKGEKKASHKDRYLEDHEEKLSKGKVVGKVALQTVPAMTSAVLTTSVVDVVTGIGRIGKALLDLREEAEKSANLDKVKLELRKRIDDERSKNDTPGYNNLNELRKEVRNQQIQTTSLQRLIEDPTVQKALSDPLANAPKYKQMLSEQIKTTFEKIKNEVSKEIGEVPEKGNLLERSAHSSKSLLQDIGKAHNPFNKYNETKKFEVNTAAPEFTKESSIYESSSKTEATTKVAKKTFSPTDLSEVDRKEFNKDSKILKHNRENKEQLSNNESHSHLEPKKQAKNFNIR